MRWRPYLMLTALAAEATGCAAEKSVEPESAASDAGFDAGAACTAGTAVVGDAPSGAGPRILVDADLARRSVGPELLGANINKWYRHAQGMWDPDARAPVADVVNKASLAGLGLLRHPGGTSANLFDWKRSVGPIDARGCQIDGGDGVGHQDRDYGPAEFMALVRAVGADAQIMVPFVNQSPADAADWVEYMNAPVGTNPGGGTAWAEVRAADGSPEPFGVTRWEIGNENDRDGHQSYWMNRDEAVRLRQYIEGAELTLIDQPAARDCDLTASTTTAAPGQTFYLPYRQIKRGTSPTVRVGGQLWTEVSSLADAGPDDRVYALDRQRATITFGDAVHGAVPATGQAVRVTYRFRHQGFVAIYDAMKATAAEIGIDIDVCAAWAPPSARGTTVAEIGAPSFAAAMEARGLADRYDCVAMHPYTNYGRDFGDVWDDAAEAHDETMLGDAWARTMVERLTDDVAARSVAGADGRPAFVTISEFGALWLGGYPSEDASQAVVPGATYMMTHALYMASQWLHFARLGVRWAEGNTLAAEPRSLRGTLGGSETGFLYGAEAMTREVLAPAFAADSSWVASRVEQPVRVEVAPGEAWDALVVGATHGADGGLRILVVNRQRSAAIEATVEPAGFAHGANVAVTTVRGDSFDSMVDGPEGAGDDSVAIELSSRVVATAGFAHEFPPASVTVLTLRPPCE